MIHRGTPESIILDLAKRLPPKSRVLDLGCGNGRNAIPLAEAEHLVEGRDSDLEALRVLRKEAAARALAIETVWTDMRNLRIGYDRWRAILAILSLHELDRVEGDNIHRYMRCSVLPGGYIALVAELAAGESERTSREKYRPSAQEIVAAYEGWEIVADTHELVLDPRGKGPRGELQLRSERLTLLARKPL